MSTIAIVGGEIDLDAREVRRAGQRWPLTRLEAGVVAAVAAADGAPVSEAALLERVWGIARATDTRAVAHTIYRLRRKIERDPRRPFHLQTELGEGFRWNSGAALPEPSRGPGAAALFGREEDLRRIGTFFAQGAAAVVLTGAGGVGKTALAAAVAAAAEQEAAAPVWVDATGARDEAGLLAAVATGLGSDLAQPEAVAAAFAHRGALLVLDNLEQVSAPAGRLIGALLAALDAAPSAARVLATSRTPLPAEDAEHLRIRPLQAEGATALFEHAVRLVRPGFLPGDSDRAATARIVAHLGGHPLALELAAARARVLDLDELESRLDASLALLSAPSASLPSRHRSMRAALDSSWALLDLHQREALSALSCFAGSFRVSDAREAFGAAVADAVEALAEAGLVERGASGLHLLLPVREYAFERLGDAHANATLAHAAWCARLGLLRQPDGAAHFERWSARLRLHRDDLALAVDRALDARAAGLAADCLAALGEAVRLAGAFALVRDRWERLRAIAAPGERIRALYFRSSSSAAAGIGLTLDDARAAHALAQDPVGGALLACWWLVNAMAPEARQEAERAAEAHLAAGGLPLVVAGALAATLGSSRRRAGAGAEASRLLLEAVSLFEQAGARADATLARNVLALTAIDERRLGEARAILETARADADAIGLDRVRANIIGNLGIVHALEGRWPEALAIYPQIEAIAARLGDNRLAALSHINRAEALRSRGDGAGAEVAGLRGLRLAEAMHDPGLALNVLHVLLHNATEHGHTSSARRFAAMVWPLLHSGTLRASDRAQLEGLARLAEGDLSGAAEIADQGGLRASDAAVLRGLIAAAAR